MGLLSMCRLASKSPFSTHSLMTFLIGAWGRVLRSISLGSYYGVCSRWTNTASIFTWIGQWCETWSIGSATMALVMAMFLVHN